MSVHFCLLIAGCWPSLWRCFSWPFVPTAHGHRLWESAATTAHSLPARLAVEHCVHEARGLDVLPSTIAKFRNNGDEVGGLALHAYSICAHGSGKHLPGQHKPLDNSLQVAELWCMSHMHLHHAHIHTLRRLLHCLRVRSTQKRWVLARGFG